MLNIFTLLIERFEIFLLILLRCSAIFIMTPVFGRKNIPTTFKVGLAFMLSIILLPTIDLEYGLRDNLLLLMLLAAREVITGLIIGFITHVIFSSLYFAGQIIDMKTGFGIVNVLDPQTSTQVPIMGNFMYIFTLVAFISMDGHLMLIRALAESFSIVPVGQMGISGTTVTEIVTILSNTFIIGFKISAPVTAAIILTEVALGILARTMPQMNVFMVGMPLKIIIGLFTMMLMIPIFTIIMDVIFHSTAEGIYKVLLQL